MEKVFATHEMMLEDVNKKAEFKYFDIKDNETKIFKDDFGVGISVLTIGDPHFRMDNLEEINIYISRIEHIVKMDKPDFVVVLGDLLHCHERVHTNVLNKAYSFINRIRKLAPVYVLVGNHDYINNSQFLSDNHWMNALKEWDNVHIVDKGMSCTTNFGKFIFCPYVFPGRFCEALDLIDKDWKSARSIFCHQEFYGCKMGAITSVEGDKWDTEYPFVISGHVHDKQRLQENIYYTGSSIQHAYGESHDKTIALCHFTQHIDVECIDLNLPRKKIIYMDFDKINEYTPTKGQDHLRITLTGSYEEFKLFRKSKKYKELLKHNIKIVYKPKQLGEFTHSTSEEFYDVLDKLVKKENNPYLDKLHSHLLDNIRNVY